MPRSSPTSFALVGVVVFGGCIVARQSLEAPPNDVTTVALLTGTLEHPMDDIARHPWFAIRRAGQKEWTTYEVGSSIHQEEDALKNHGYHKPILHGLWRGAEADRAADCIERVAPEIKRYIEKHYIFYPGPNSNTFGDRVMRKCGIHASLPSTSVGKDWRGLIGAGVTSEGTGLQLETPFVGLKIGLKEGVEIHVLGLSFGVDLWPPALILPLGPGRLGFADR